MVRDPIQEAWTVSFVRVNRTHDRLGHLQLPEDVTRYVYGDGVSCPGEAVG